jgi:hypothetical protein
MWHGFSFDYRAPAARLEVDCRILSNRKQDTVDPAAERDRDVTETWFSFELDRAVGSYVRAQYTTNVRGTPFNRTTTCFHRGEPILQFSLNLTPQ